MKHKYNTPSCLSVFPSNPVLDTVANTAKNAQKNDGLKIQENKKKFDKKIKFPPTWLRCSETKYLGMRHVKCTQNTEGRTQNFHGEKKKFPNTFKIKRLQMELFTVSPRQSDQNSVYLLRKKMFQTCLVTAKKVRNR